MSMIGAAGYGGFAVFWRRVQYGVNLAAARTRLQFPDLGTPAQNTLRGKLAGLENELKRQDIPGGVEDAKSAAEVAENAKCETCEKREY